MLLPKTLGYSTPEKKFAREWEDFEEIGRITATEA